MKKRIFIIYTIITLIFFGILIKMEYATDTYSVFNFNKEQIYMQYAMSGRFITAIIGKLIKITNFSERAIYIGSFMIAMLCAITSQYKLYRVIEKDVKSKILRLLIPILIIINPFSIELFLYIEKGIMWLGILMCIISLENIIKFFEISYNSDIIKDNKNNEKPKFKYIIYAILLMFIANCSYQGIIGIFVAISLIYILKYSKTFKQFVTNNIIVALIYGIPTIINYLSVKILYKASRVNGNIIFLESIQKIYLNTIDMYKNMYNLLPKYLFIFLILFTFSAFCCKIFKEKGKVLHCIKFFYIIVGVTFFAIIPQIVQPTYEIWFVPRTTYCFASMYGILVLYLSINYEIKNIWKIAIILVSLILLLVQVQKFIQIEQGRFLLNKKDEQITMQIIEQINKYEEQTGNTVRELSVYQDKMANYTYKDIFATGDVNVKCYANGWSAVSILNYYLKRDIKLVENDKTKIQEFLEQNWDEFNIEQIKFEQNKLILCNY